MAHIYNDFFFCHEQKRVLSWTERVLSMADVGHRRGWIDTRVSI